MTDTKTALENGIEETMTDSIVKETDKDKVDLVTETTLTNKEVIQGTFR
jgi:major membrane immunogen (membrane-anchored lipoprotein)